MKKTVSIDGMSCQHCVMGVTRALSALDGVSGVSVSLEDKKATFEASDAVSDSAIKEAVYDAGFDVTSIETA